MKHLLFCGGGSAGHVTPNLAVMDALRKTYRITYMGTGGIEKTLVEGAGYPFLQVDCPKLIRSFTPRNLTIPVRLIAAEKKACRLLRADPPDLVFSKGGFASYPAVRAAHRLHIPALTHESDLTPGLATRMMARLCKNVLTSFPETAERFRHGICTGSPMRRELFARSRTEARVRYRLWGERPVLLVLGGGSGSRTLNEAVRQNLNELLRSWRILHLCGRGNVLADPPPGYVQREYEADMGSAYAACDLVLSRAGSNTIFELLALRKPALLVPLARCSRGDQLANAAYFCDRGLCRMLAETELPRLAEALLALYRDDALRAALAHCQISDGTPAVVARIEALAPPENRSP